MFFRRLPTWLLITIYVIVFCTLIFDAIDERDYETAIGFFIMGISVPVFFLLIGFILNRIVRFLKRIFFK